MKFSIRDAADRWLRIPELRGIEDADFDLPHITAIQKQIFKKKSILGFLYKSYCRPIMASAKSAPKNARMLEIGAGLSPLKEHLPNLICSDLVHLPWFDLTCSADALPFKSRSLDRIFLLFVCHHINDMEKFLHESYRCLKPGGEMVIVDPAITLFSKIYYRYCHVDEMDIHAREWVISGQGRLTTSNVALPWIVFCRDRDGFHRLFPGLEIKTIAYNTCLSFLLSGGLRIRQLLPTPILKQLFFLENWAINNISNQLAVTMMITIKKR